MKDSWSLEWIRAQVLQEEFRRKELTAAAGEGGGSAYGMKSFKGRGSKKGKAKEGSGGEQYSGGKRSNKGGKRCGGKCWYCHVEGHLWFKCRKLPDDWRPGQPSIEGSKSVHGAMGEGMGSEEGDGGAGGHGGMFYHPCLWKHVLLVPGLCANLLSTKALSEAGMKMEIMGTKVLKATLDGRVLWDHRGGKDMHQSTWEIPVLPWKEAAARLAAEAVRGGHASHVTSGGGGDGSDGGLLVHGGGALPSWQLRCPIYGLHQAPREWHDMLHTTLAALDFFPLSANPSLFIRRGLTPFFVFVYVDDLVFATPDRHALASVKE
ncbi:unnamed protein product [Closterium sp. NIES-53]